VAQGAQGEPGVAREVGEPACSDVAVRLERHPRQTQPARGGAPRQATCPRRCSSPFPSRCATGSRRRGHDPPGVRAAPRAIAPSAPGRHPSSGFQDEVNGAHVAPPVGGFGADGALP
jgi:hypothetical protein